MKFNKIWNKTPLSFLARVEQPQHSPTAHSQHPIQCHQKGFIYLGKTQKKQNKQIKHAKYQIWNMKKKENIKYEK